MKRAFNEQESLNFELEGRMRQIEFWCEELNRREALIEHERQKLEEEKTQHNLRSKALQMAMEEVMRHLGDHNNEAQKDMDPVALISELLAVLRLKNEELQAARHELIMGWYDMQSCEIGIKWMGRIDRTAFIKTCRERFPPGEAGFNAHKLLLTWQETIGSSECRPFRIIGDEKGNLQKLVDEDSMLLQSLRSEWGDEIYNAVTTAMKEQYEYNCNGFWPVAELWNFKQNRKASLKEGIQYIVRQWKTLSSKSA